MINDIIVIINELTHTGILMGILSLCRLLSILRLNIVASSLLVRRAVFLEINAITGLPCTFSILWGCFTLWDRMFIFLEFLYSMDSLVSSASP